MSKEKIVCCNADWQKVTQIPHPHLHSLPDGGGNALHVCLPTPIKHIGTSERPHGVALNVDITLIRNNLEM